MTKPLMPNQAEPNGPVILMYHSIEVGTRSPKWPWAVSLSQFKAHLDLLKKLNYHTTTIAKLARAETQRPRTVVITFDDGYSNNLAAFDALQERDMCATWFVVSGAVGQKPHWPLPKPADKLILSKENLRMMAEAGMEIGSHSVNHQRLADLNSADLQREANDSKKTLEDILGQRVSSFAYPYGEKNTNYEAALVAADYSAACTVDSGWAMLDNNPLRLRRISIFNKDTCVRLQRKLSFASNDVGLRFLATYYQQRIVNRLLPSHD